MDEQGIEDSLDSLSFAGRYSVSSVSQDESDGTPTNSKSASDAKDEEAIPQSPSKSKNKKREISPPKFQKGKENSPVYPIKSKNTKKEDKPESPIKEKVDTIITSTDTSEDDERTGSPKEVKRWKRIRRWTKKAVMRKSALTTGASNSQRDTESDKEDSFKGTEFEENMVKKNLKRKAKDDKAEDILEEVLSISGSPGSPSKVKKSKSVETESASPSNSCGSVSPIKPKKQDKSPGTPTNSKSASDGKDKDAVSPSPSKVKKSRRTSPPNKVKDDVRESPSKAKRAKRDTSPPTDDKDEVTESVSKAKKTKQTSPPTLKAKKGKEMSPMSPTKAKKAKKEEKPESPTKEKVDSIALADTSEDDEKAASPKKVKKSYADRSPIKGLPHGWFRKTSIRQSGKTAGQVDIYFFAPDGTKLRSKPDVVSYLKKKKLAHKIELFNFSRRADKVGPKKIDPKKEAKVKPVYKKEGKKVKEIKKVKETIDSEDEANEEKVEDEIVDKKHKEGKKNEVKNAKGGNVQRKLRDGTNKRAKGVNHVDDGENSHVAENGDENDNETTSSDSEEEKVLKKGTKVVIQIKPSKKKRTRK